MEQFSNDNKEIDLLDLVVNGYLFCKKYFILFLIAILLGCGIGFIKEKNTTTYTLKSSLNSNIILQQIAPSLLKDISLNFKNKQYLSYILKTPIDNCKQIQEITFKTVSIFDQQIIKLEVISTDKVVANTCMQSLKLYLLNYALYKEQIALYKLQRNFLLSRINEKILSLDSLQKSIIIKLQKPTPQLIINYSFYSEYINLIERKQLIEKEKFVLDSKFSVNNKTLAFLNTKNYKIACFKYGGLLLFVSIMIALFIEFTKTINIHIAQNKE